jgi:hypothetical protein
VLSAILRCSRTIWLRCFWICCQTMFRHCCKFRSIVSLKYGRVAGNRFQASIINLPNLIFQNLSTHV